MATKKAGGTAKNLRDSQPKYLGVKRGDGQAVKKGDIIIRQRGTKFVAGKNVRMGTDHTLFSVAEGKVAFKNVRKTRFDGTGVIRKSVTVG